MAKLPFWPFGLNPEYEHFYERLATKLTEENGWVFSLTAAQKWYEEEERKFRETDPEAIAFART